MFWSSWTFSSDSSMRRRLGRVVPLARKRPPHRPKPSNIRPGAPCKANNKATGRAPGSTRTHCTGNGLWLLGLGKLGAWEDATHGICNRASGLSRTATTCKAGKRELASAHAPLADTTIRQRGQTGLGAMGLGQLHSTGSNGTMGLGQPTGLWLAGSALLATGFGLWLPWRGTDLWPLSPGTGLWLLSPGTGL